MDKFNDINTGDIPEKRDFTTGSTTNGGSFAGQGEFAKDNLTGHNTSGPDANTPVKLLTAKSIIGDQVLNLKGEDLGEIKDIMLNLQNGSIQYVVLSFGGILGMGDKLFAIPFQALQLDPGKEVFILNKEKDFLEKAPGFDKDHWPETNGHHYDDVNSYWGDFVGNDTRTTF